MKQVFKAIISNDYVQVVTFAVFMTKIFLFCYSMSGWK